MIRWTVLLQCFKDIKKLDLQNWSLLLIVSAKFWHSIDLAKGFGDL